MMICFYYGLTAIGCVWYFRKELFTSFYNFIFKFLLPAARRARPERASSS